MRRGLTLVGVAACGFTGPPRIADHPPTDAVAAPDVALSPGCAVTAVGTGAPLAGNVGEQATPPGNFQHGAMQNPIVCAGAELPLAFGVYTTINPVFEGGTERVVRSLTVRCGTLSVTQAGALAIAFAETIQTPYGGCEPAWGDNAMTDVTIAPPVSCPNGEVPIGLTANGGTGSLFNTVAVACSPLATSGTIGPTSDPVAIVDSGNYTNKPQRATCPANTALVSFTWRGNCGVDELTPVCAALACR